MRTFGSFTADLHRLAQWLKACEIETVVMHATGVYWVALHNILEDYGFQVKVVNARHTKTLARAQNGRAGMSTVTEATHVRIVEQFVPAGGGDHLTEFLETVRLKFGGKSILLP